MGIKKGMAQTDYKATEAVLMALSKAALADLVVDLIRRAEGETIDGRTLAEAVVAAAEPVCLARGDRVPSSHVFWESMRPEFACQHADRVSALREEWSNV
jgi:hypothetical protein